MSKSTSPSPAPDPHACEFVVVMAGFRGEWSHPGPETVLTEPLSLKEAMRVRLYLYRRSHKGWMYGVRHQPSRKKMTDWRRGRLEYREAQALPAIQEVG